MLSGKLDLQTILNDNNNNDNDHIYNIILHIQCILSSWCFTNMIDHHSRVHNLSSCEIKA